VTEGQTPVADDVEVVVVGAGPAGSVAAASLAERGRDVLLVDQNEFPRDKPCGDGLTHSAVEVIEELGLGSLAERGHAVEDCRIVIAHGAEMKGWYRPPARLPRSRFMRTVRCSRTGGQAG
jgi:2-polyprenyl-6-methoxyphenol hydroxylase-like FAD-dependent oxidoreductase